MKSSESMVTGICDVHPSIHPDINLGMDDANT
jgi:hypothetical protein